MQFLVQNLHHYAKDYAKSASIRKNIFWQSPFLSLSSFQELHMQSVAKLFLQTWPINRKY